MDSSLKANEQKNVRDSERYRSSVSYLFNRINYERLTKMPYSSRDLNIQRMRQLFELLGNPHNQLKIVHIAGTKGKGSTSAFLVAAVAESGGRCGSYSSPHLHHLEERFRINGVPCSPEQLIRLVDHIRPAVESMDADFPGGGPTFFEICTAMAAVFFVQQHVDLTVLEVGLGGRLDSTNVCHPLVSVITSISYDHTKQLGNTIAKIASEKAGIIKPRIPVVSGATHPEAFSTISKIADDHDSKLFQLGREFDFDNYRAASSDALAQVDFHFASNGTHLSDVRLGMLGQHQAANAAVACTALNQLPDDLRPSEAAIRRGFECVRSEARCELISRRPVVLIDAAHNVASAKALVHTLREFDIRGRRKLIAGLTEGKDIDGILSVLLPEFDEINCTQYQKNPRAFCYKTLFDKAAHFQPSVAELGSPRLRQFANPIEAWRHVSATSTDEDLICVSGSFFIAAELREIATEY